MSWTLIKVPPSTPEMDFFCAVGGATYKFHILWNDRDQSFYMDLAQSDGTPIFSSARMVLHAYIGRTANQPPTSQGVFMVIDTSGNLAEAGIDDLGARVQLVWIPQTSLLAFARPAS